MPLRRRLVPLMLAVALVSMLLPFTAAGAVTVDSRIERWAQSASSPDAVLAAISAHQDKLPAEFAERLRHLRADGTLQVMVALASRDAAIETAMESGSTWLKWYGNAPRLLARVTPDQLGALLEHAGVVFVEPDYKISHFMSTSTLDVHARSLGAAGNGVWSFDSGAGSLGSLVSDVPGLSVEDATGKDIVVQITDSGIDRTHKDFGGWDCVLQPYLPCESRIVRAVAVDHLVGAGADPGDLLPTTEAASGHGTHVAGTIAGNGYYTRDGDVDPERYGADGHNFGIAPQAKLISVKNGDTIWAGLSSFALQWTLDHAEEYNIRVSSNSWGCIGGCSFNGNSVDGQLFRDLYNAGVVVTFAAGNDGGGTNGAAFSGYAQSPYVLGVASYDDANGNRLASSSSRGLGTTGLVEPRTWTPESEGVNGVRRPDVAAPGVSIWSARTLTGGAASGTPRINVNDALGGGSGGFVPYAQMSGTSMATPHVSGAAALLFGACDAAAPLDVMRAIMVGADPTNVLSTDGSQAAQPYEAGYGALEIRASLDWLRSQPVCGGTGGGEPTPTPTDTASPTPTPTETVPSGEATTTRYYFHSPTGFQNADLFIGGNTFDEAEPTFTSDSYALDFPLATKGGSGALYDPSWTGEVPGTINELTVDFWQQSPRGLVGGLAFDVTLWAGETAHAIGTFSAEASDPSAPSRVTHTFPDLDIPVTGPVTLDINDTVEDLEEGTAIVFDSVDHPSGFSVTTVDGGADPTPTPTSDPTTPPGGRGTYPTAPSDPLFASQWGMTRINVPQAWQESRATGFGINIAIVDSGLDLGHEDLACAGKVRVLPGSDVADGDGDPNDETDGHGTHVAGIAAACSNNGKGVVGVAPDATLIPVRATGGNGDFDEAMADGIRFATDSGAHVINLSIGPVVGESAIAPFTYPLTQEALQYAADAGVVIAAASGNWSQPYCEFPSLSRHVICVSATDRNDLKSYYSDHPINVDPEDPDGPGIEPGVVAPGGQGTFCEEGIVSTFPAELESVCYTPGYESLDGTSMASPHVAGVAALVYDRLGGERSAANARTVVQTILDSAEDLGTPGWDPVFGNGLVDALAAVKAITVTDPTPTAAATSVSFTEGSAEAGQYSDAARIAAQLVDAGSGAPISGETLTFTLTNGAETITWDATTDEEGIAADSLQLHQAPGPYSLTVAYGGRDDVFLPSGDVVSFVIEREDTATVADVSGKGGNRVVSATLTEADATTALEGRTVVFFADGVEIGSAVTGADGSASIGRIPDEYRGDRFEFEARFEGDELYGGSSGTTHS